MRTDIGRSPCDLGVLPRTTTTRPADSLLGVRGAASSTSSRSLRAFGALMRTRPLKLSRLPDRARLDAVPHAEVAPGGRAGGASAASSNAAESHSIPRVVSYASPILGRIPSWPRVVGIPRHLERFGGSRSLRSVCDNPHLDAGVAKKLSLSPVRVDRGESFGESAPGRRASSDRPRHKRVKSEDIGILRRSPSPTRAPRAPRLHQRSSEHQKKSGCAKKLRPPKSPREPRALLASAASVT